MYPARGCLPDRAPARDCRGRGGSPAPQSLLPGPADTNVSAMRSPLSGRSQVSLRTAFTVCFAVTAMAALVLFVLQTRVALALTVCSAMVAVALNHVVHQLERRKLKRGWAIALVMGAVCLVGAGVLLLIIPAAVTQGRELIQQAPKLLDELRQSRVFAALDRQFGIEQSIKGAVTSGGQGSQSGGTSVLGAIGGLLSGLAGAATLAALVVFMLVFGPRLVRDFFHQLDPEIRARWERITTRSYASIGGYLGGLLLICTVNATLTTICLAILRLPFFLPLGILSGFSSLVPYAGPVTVGALITVTALLTSGAVKAGIVLGYFLLYGQFEGNVLGPYVFRRVVHLDPLVTLLSVLFLAELLGIVGAIVAVPAVAVAQIVLRDLLRLRRERLAADAPVKPAAQQR
jgi:predicted PurR-regulated permease PerM